MGWGRTVLPVWPGRYHVYVYTPYLVPSALGPADCVVDVAPGQLLELEYKAPVWAFSRGALGPAPQPFNGLGALIAVTVALLLVFFAAVIGYVAFA